MKNKLSEIELKTPSSNQQSQFSETVPLTTLKSLQSAMEAGSLPLNERFTLEWNQKQWILKKHFGNKNPSFCTTKEALIRCLGKDYPYAIAPDAWAFIEDLPETIREWLKITPSPPLKGEG